MFAKRDLILAQEYLGFLLLNMFDLFLTGWIFKHGGSEANGVAVWVLHRYGLAGFAVFKFLLVAFLIIVCELISLASIQRARLLILGGCALYVCVVFWECYLIFQHIDKPQVAPPPQTGAIVRPLVAPPTHDLAGRYRLTV